MERLEPLWVYLPSELKLELELYAARNNLYLTQVVLPLLADHIGRSDLVPVKRRPYNPGRPRAESVTGRKWYTGKGKLRNPGGMERLRINIPAELKLEVKTYAARNKLSFTEIAIPLIADHIRRSDLVPAKWKPRNPEGERKEIPQ